MPPPMDSRKDCSLTRCLSFYSQGWQAGKLAPGGLRLLPKNRNLGPDPCLLSIGVYLNLTPASGRPIKAGWEAEPDAEVFWPLRLREYLA